MSKNNEKSESLLIPKISLRFNPSDMKDYSSSDNKIDVNNIFALNRLGFSDTLESGKSLTLGIDYIKKKIWWFKRNKQLFWIKTSKNH
mgnify:CR=1 FL=1